MRKITGTIDPAKNPIWPPGLHKFVMIQKVQPDGTIYLGKIMRIVSSGTAAVIKLIGGQSYDDKEVVPYLPSNIDQRGYMLAIETDAWRIVSANKAKSLLGNEIYSEMMGEDEPEIGKELLFDNARPDDVTLDSVKDHSATKNPLVNVPLSKLIDLQDIDDFAFLSRQDIEFSDRDRAVIADIGARLTLADGVPKKIATKSETNIEGIVPPKVRDHRHFILNLLENSIVTYESGETQYIEDINKPTEKVINQNLLDSYYDRNQTLAEEAIEMERYIREQLKLTGPDREIQKGESVDELLYGSIRFIYYNGYLHIFRKGFPLVEVINHDLLEDADDHKIKILGEREYNRPIRHNILKYILFQNEIQKTFNVDQRLLQEAELILSQEYIIAMTPEPRYQLWCVVRLIKLWYGDVDLQNNIRKIKLIVNQWRVRADQNYNRQNGIRFSIGIYPRYGKKSASLVLKKLMYYFSIYFQAVGWKNNPPSYFKVMNDLISYSNGAQSLKLYYRRISEMNNEHSGAFSKHLTKVNSTIKNTDILEQYVRH